MSDDSDGVSSLTFDRALQKGSSAVSIQFETADPCRRSVDCLQARHPQMSRSGPEPLASDHGHDPVIVIAPGAFAGRALRRVGMVPSITGPRGRNNAPLNNKGGTGASAVRSDLTDASYCAKPAQ